MLSSITDWDFSVLDKMDGIRNEVLTAILKVFTHLSDGGIFWIALCLVLLIIPKTRRIGIYASCALLLEFLLGEVTLKHIIRRERPFIQDPTIDTIIKHPGGFSFPSGHSASSVATALSIFLQNKKLGAPLLVVAVIVMFSRVYFKVHFFTDIIAGCLLGIAASLFIYYLFKHIEKKRHFADNENN